MRQIADQAIILSRIDYGEKDRILTLLCKQEGKVSALAKSVRSPKSRLAGGVELLSTSEVTYIQGKSSLHTLTGARLIRYYGSIASDLERTQQAFALLKLVAKLSEEGAGQEYFELIEQVLAALEDQTYDPKLVEIWSAVKLLANAGVLSDIASSSEDDKTFEFDHDTQQFIARPDGPFNRNDLKLLKLSLSQPRPLKLQKPTGSEDRLVLLLRLLLKTNLTEV